MYVGDDLAFVQIHKTASTFIAGLLHRLYGGELIEEEKHEPLPAAIRESGRSVLASIRSPWDWYVSLWAFGTMGRGIVHNGVTNRNRAGTAELWRSVYADARDLEAFRTWLRMVHDPDRATDIGDHSGGSVPPWGLFTHRYLALCWIGGPPQDVDSIEGLAAEDHVRCYVDEFVRTEDLPESLVAALETVRPVSSRDRRIIAAAPRLNASPRAFPLAEYYDDTTVELVARSEAFLVRRFGYEPPV